ncbi:MAG: type II secretion system protein [Pseudomonadota bacterium]
MKADLQKQDLGGEGFSLLEVIVVLALVSVAMVPLFQMQNTLSQSSRRALDQTMVSQALQTTLNHFENVNIAEQPVGQLTLSETTINWSATLVESHQRPSGLYEQNPAPEVRLYSVQLNMADNTGRQLFSDEFNMVGWAVRGDGGR